MKDSSFDLYALFVGCKRKIKWQLHKSTSKNHKLSKPQNKSIIPCAHCKKMEHWNFECFKNKTRIVANLTVINHKNNKKKRIWK